MERAPDLGMRPSETHLFEKTSTSRGTSPGAEVIWQEQTLNSDPPHRTKHEPVAAYPHDRTGETNADAHLKRLIMAGNMASSTAAAERVC